MFSLVIDHAVSELEDTYAKSHGLIIPNYAMKPMNTTCQKIIWPISNFQKLRKFQNSHEIQNIFASFLRSD